MPRTLKVIDVVDALEYHEPGAQVYVWYDGGPHGHVKSIFRLTPGLAKDLGIEEFDYQPGIPCPVIISVEKLPRVDPPWHERTSRTS